MTDSRTVYIVTETIGMTVEGDTSVRGVWSTREAAEAQLDRLSEIRRFDEQEILEVEINSELDSAWGP